MFFERYNIGRVERGTSTTRGNSFKLFQKRVNSNIAKYSFGNRVVRVWNSLSNTVVQASSSDVFKGRVQDYLVHSLGLV